MAMAESERTMRELGRGVPGPGRQIDVAGVVALTDPGPAAAGIVVTDGMGRRLAHRAHYLGTTSRRDATAQALLGAVRLAREGGLVAPILRVDDPELAAALQAGSRAGAAELPELQELRENLAGLPGYHLETIAPGVNRARAVALTPLIDWLPERTRRAEGLRVRPVGDGRYEVESESEPGRVYHVTLRSAPPAGVGEDAELISCECADFLYRGIPCKHLFAVARETGDFDSLFYPAQQPSRRATPDQPPPGRASPDRSGP
jgi:hypothetical protein